MDRHLIVPGYTNSKEKHWQTAWEQAWGKDARRIAPASWDHPDLDDWLRAIDRAVAQLKVGPKDRLVVVAHSLGTWASAEWLRRRRPRNAVAFMVAAPDLQGEAFAQIDAPTFATLGAERLPVPALVVASDDDPYCSREASRRIALGWGARWTSVGALGHINSASDLGMWEQGQMLLAGLH